MRLFDSHCHLDFPEFDADRDTILRHCRELGITGIVIPGVTQSGWARLCSLCATHRGLLHPALGLHPLFLEQHRESDLEKLAEEVRNRHPVAIGEIGLDYYVAGADRERQRDYFEAQLAIARDAGLPVILHVRKAHDMVLHILRRYRLKGGIAHAFNGSRQQAERYLELGFKLGFGGAVTYPRAKKLRRLVQELPLEGMVLETDAPDMTPVAHRGQRNQPDYLPEILEVVARLRQDSPDRIAAQTTENAITLFALRGDGTHR